LFNGVVNGGVAGNRKLRYYGFTSARALLIRKVKVAFSKSLV